MIFKATLIPSRALDIMPPAYPAPSPIGYRPFVDTLSRSSFLLILTGHDDRVSGPTIIPESIKPGIRLSKYSNASIKALLSFSSKKLLKLYNTVPSEYDDSKIKGLTVLLI